MCLGRGAWLCPFSIGNSYWLSDSFVMKSLLPALACTFPHLLSSCTFIPHWSSFCARRSPALSHLRSSSHQKSSFNIPTLASLSLSLNLLLDPYSLAGPFMCVLHHVIRGLDHSVCALIFHISQSLRETNLKGILLPSIGLYPGVYK